MNNFELKKPFKKIYASLKFEGDDPKIELEYGKAKKISSFHSIRTIPLKIPIEMRIFNLEPNEIKFQEEDDKITIILEDDVARRLSSELEKKLGEFKISTKYRGHLHTLNLNKNTLFYHEVIIKREGKCGGDKCKNTVLIYYCHGCYEYFCKGNCYYNKHEHTDDRFHECKGTELLKYTDVNEFRKIFELKIQDLKIGVHIGLMINNFLEINERMKPQIKLCAVKVQEYPEYK